MWAIFQALLKTSLQKQQPLFFTARKSIFVLFLCGSFLASSEPTVFSNPTEALQGVVFGRYSESPTRTKISLAGLWQVSLNGSAEQKTLRIPSSIDFEGESVFQRTFTIDPALLSSSSFKFVAYGINNDCEILINDIFIGKHIGGYSVFEFPIPESVLKPHEKNEIKLIIKNTLRHGETIPPRTQIWGWKNYHGILRDVFLFATPQFFLDSVAIRSKVTPDAQEGEVYLSALLRTNGFQRLGKDTSRLYTVSLELYSANGENLITAVSTVPFSSSAASNVNLSLRVLSPQLWSPETPVLYRVRVKLFLNEAKQKKLIDQFEQNIGFVSVVTGGGVLKINGTKTKLKGVVWHEDAPEFGASLLYEQMEKDIALIKSLGANALRCAFHPPHPYIVNLCNRYGLFVLLELPVWEATGKELASESYQAKAEALAAEMIYTFAAAPSVLAWGIGTSFDSADPQAITYVRRLTRFFQHLDDRLVYYGTAMLQNDVCAAEVPLVGILPMTGDSKEFKRAVDSWKRNHPNQLCVVLGYGKEVVHENRNGYTDPLSQQAQARFFLQHTTALHQSSIAGGFIDAFADWRSVYPILSVPANDPTLSPRGILSATRQKRIAFDVVRALYSEGQIAPLPVGKYKAPFPFVHLGSGFFLLAVVGYLFTYNRRFGETLRRALWRSYNFFEDLREKRGASPFHTFFVVLLLAHVLALLTSSLFYYYRMERVFDYLITALLPWHAAKELIIYIVWSTFGGLLLLTGIYVAIFVLAFFVARLITALLGKRFLWFQTIAVMGWGSVPLLFLVPLAMILFKILQTPTYTLPTLLFIGVAFGWVYIRILNGIAITYELSRTKVHLWGILICIFLLGGIYAYYETAVGISSVAYYLFHLLENTI